MLFRSGKPPPPPRRIEAMEPENEPVEEGGDMQQEGAPAAPLAMPPEDNGGQESNGRAVPQDVPAPLPVPAFPVPQPQG